VLDIVLKHIGTGSGLSVAAIAFLDLDDLTEKYIF